MSSAVCFVSAAVMYFHFGLFASYGFDMANEEAICFGTGSFDTLFGVGFRCGHANNCVSSNLQRVD